MFILIVSEFRLLGVSLADIVNFMSIPYTMQYETLFDWNIISSGEKYVNGTHLGKLRHGTKWCT